MIKKICPLRFESEQRECVEDACAWWAKDRCGVVPQDVRFDIDVGWMECPECNGAGRFYGTHAMMICDRCNGTGIVMRGLHDDD